MDKYIIREQALTCIAREHTRATMNDTSKDITQKKLGAVRQQSVPLNYNDAIKALIASGKAEEILCSEKAKLLSTPAFTPSGYLSPNWAEHINAVKSRKREEK